MRYWIIVALMGTTLAMAGTLEDRVIELEVKLETLTKRLDEHETLPAEDHQPEPIPDYYRGWYSEMLYVDGYVDPAEVEKVVNDVLDKKGDAIKACAQGTGLKTRREFMLVEAQLVVSPSGRANGGSFQGDRQLGACLENFLDDGLYPKPPQAKEATLFRVVHEVDTRVATTSN